MPIRRTLSIRNAPALRLCAFASSGDAAQTEQPGSPFIVDSWSSEEGLPDNEVISVIQTRDGYLWLGTLNGLVRFDGIHFTIFDENNTPGLAEHRIVYLFEDNQTNLWVGTDPPVWRDKKRDRKNFETESANRGRSNVMRSKIHKATSGFMRDRRNSLFITMAKWIFILAIQDFR